MKIKSAEVTNKLVSGIITTHRLNLFNEAIDIIINMLYQPNTDVNKALDEQMPINSVSEDLIVYLKEVLAAEGKNGAIAYLKAVKEGLYAIPKVKVMLAFDPTVLYLEELHNIMKELLNKMFLIELEIDQQLVGGLVMINEGYYTDLSLKSHVNAYINGNSDKIKTLLSWS